MFTILCRLLSLTCQCQNLPYMSQEPLESSLGPAFTWQTIKSNVLLKNFAEVPKVFFNSESNKANPQWKASSHPTLRLLSLSLPLGFPSLFSLQWFKLVGQLLVLQALPREHSVNPTSAKGTTTFSFLGESWLHTPLAPELTLMF